jgi:hypothetical protein
MSYRERKLLSIVFETSTSAGIEDSTWSLFIRFTSSGSQSNLFASYPAPNALVLIRANSPSADPTMTSYSWFPRRLTDRAVIETLKQLTVAIAKPEIDIEIKLMVHIVSEI